jgi:allantoinase
MNAIKCKQIVTPNAIVDGYVLYENGKIVDVVRSIDSQLKPTIIDATNSVVMPGIIDCHVHINEPGRTDWEGFETATKAAAASGITTLIEMPLNASPVTTTAKNLKIKLAAAQGKLTVNCGFWGGVVPDNIDDLEELLKSGVFGLKAFLTHSGIDDFPNTTAQHLRQALLILKKHNLPLLVHCELDTLHADAELLNVNPTSYEAYLKSRPKSWENDAVQMMIDLCRETDARVHIVHVSSAEALPMIAAAKKEGLKITAETCPHYLVFDAENIADGDTSYKCAPPIRESENNQLLWKALKDGTLDFVVTDHSPAPPNLKEIESGNFKKAWGGIAGLQFLLSSFWTKAREHHFTISETNKLLSENTAAFIGLQNSKGKIAIGFDADFVIWNPDKKFVVKEKDILHRHKITPYKNLELYGVVEKTIVNGVVVFDDEITNLLNIGKTILQTFNAI